ncbi:hypothetical protein [Nostoc sp.]
MAIASRMKGDRPTSVNIVGDNLRSLMDSNALMLVVASRKQRM